MVQEFHVVRCCACSTCQVHIIRKDKKFSCKMCGQKQSVRKDYGKGTARECRTHVQKLNTFIAGQNEERDRNLQHKIYSYCNMQTGCQTLADEENLFSEKKIVSSFDATRSDVEPPVIAGAQACSSSEENDNTRRLEETSVFSKPKTMQNRSEEYHEEYYISSQSNKNIEKNKLFASASNLKVSTDRNYSVSLNDSRNVAGSANIRQSHCFEKYNKTLSRYSDCNVAAGSVNNIDVIRNFSLWRNNDGLTSAAVPSPSNWSFLVRKFDGASNNEMLDTKGAGEIRCKRLKTDTCLPVRRQPSSSDHSTHNSGATVRTRITQPASDVPSNHIKTPENQDHMSKHVCGSFVKNVFSKYGESDDLDDLNL